MASRQTRSPPSWWLAAALSLAGAALSPPAAAQIRIDGSYRFRVAGNGDLALDDRGGRLGQTAWAEHRFRLAPKAIYGEVAELQASLDLLSGLVLGDLAPSFSGLGFTGRSARQGVAPEGFDFRHFFFQLRLPGVQARFGQMANHWGLGLLHHGGEDETQTDFGDVRFGDIVERLQFTVRPFASPGARSALAQHLLLSLGADLVYRDRWASLVNRSGDGLTWGDAAWQLVSTLRFDPSDDGGAGFYVARRIQDDARGTDFHVWVFDLQARLAIAGLPGDATLRLEAEAAAIEGGTSRVMRANGGSSRVSQQGGVARATWSVNNLELELEGGYASGDRNPLDGDLTGFTTSRDYKVSLVLWDEVVLFHTQRAAQRLSDPVAFGRPAPGVEWVPTEGAITNAFWLKPTVRLRPAAFGGRLKLVGAALFARAPEPVLDPYQTTLLSAARNAFGAPAGQSYGLELDGAASWTARVAERGLELGAQAGILFPGDVFALPQGGRMANAWAVKLRATFLF